MSREYKFYYDESEHSRKINKSTITSANYYDNFVVTIVGWESSDEEIIEEKYITFENKYSDRKSNGELKSTTLKPKHFRNGFASLNQENVEFIGDFLNLFDEKILLYFSVSSKIEFIIQQLFINYTNSIFKDMDAMKYSIVKSILMYRPQEIISGIYENTGELIQLLKDFYSQKLTTNLTNPELKRHENVAFTQILLLLDAVNEDIEINWSYDSAFYGFDKYINEKGIKSYSLYLDKEGEDSNTLKAARKLGISKPVELDSKVSVGIRISDILAGIISKLLKALHFQLRYEFAEDGIGKKILSGKWFEVSDQQLGLYKQLYLIIGKLNNAWFKSFGGIYSDDFIVLVSFLNYLSKFESVAKMNEFDRSMFGEDFNAYVCSNLNSYFQRMHSKLNIEPITSLNEEFYYNQRGAKVFYDISKQPLLEILEGSQIYYVLSVGFSNNMVPTVTIEDKGETTCYKLEQGLLDWVIYCVSFANMGGKIFPSRVLFCKVDNEYYADIL
ncbi:DUF3800 domain-containing protein [Bacillus sp. 1NLA3E]|uniref:DUF3800 domain-containing protein n=1 Tax=Bacillus sp. 1NLA3E TaxID=666686 RepID=UPI000247E5BD|nr:DUF3800 domain-containing protein [Bacillus sp. 1NLA3E]AGK52266.1 hypothetical protein B1NLA3E_02410 [Bacillus sp. 1NLA3E]